MTYDILGIGYVAVDDLLYVDSYPPPDHKARVLHCERHCGGLTATALLTAARLGARCAYAGVLGDDDLSRFAVESLESGGIDLSHLRRGAGCAPAHSTIIVDKVRGTRNIFSDLRGFSAGDPEEVTEELVRSARILFVDHADVAVATRAARIARRGGIPVVADVERDEDPDFAELLGLVDHLIVSRAFAERLTGDTGGGDLVEGLSSNRRRCVVVTDGAAGCWYRDVTDGAVRHAPAFAVEAIDTTGCGDVFHGAYAWALAAGRSAEDRVLYASAAAALNATAAGACGGAPDRDALEAFLRKRT